MQKLTTTLTLAAALLCVGTATAQWQTRVGRNAERRVVNRQGLKQARTALPALADEQITLPELYGVVSYSRMDTPGIPNTTPGLYRLGADGLLTSEVGDHPGAFYGGGFSGPYYYSISDQYDGTFVKVFKSRYTFNPAATTPEQRWIKDYTKECSGQLESTDMAIDPTTGYAYGCFLNETGEFRDFGYLDLESDAVTVITQLDLPVQALAFDSEGNLYAIDAYNYLTRVDKTTGTMTNVADRATGLNPSSMVINSCSAAIDKDGKFMFIAETEDNGAYLCAVNLTTGVATRLFQYANDEQINGLSIPTGITGAMPAVVSNLAANFTDGALEGTVTFNAPGRTIDGTKGEGNLTYTVTMDGTELASAACAWSDKVSVPATTTQGRHTFAATTTNAAGKSYSRSIAVWVGNDTPKAPEVTLARTGQENTLTWTLPETGVNEGYVDAQAATYKIVRYPEQVVVAEAATGNTFTDNVPDTGNVTQVYYGVTATANSLTSAEGLTSKEVVGYIQPPYSQTFDTQEAFNTFTVINVDDDTSKWTWREEDGNGIARCNYTGMRVNNDYLITPRLYLQGGNTYCLRFDANASKNKEERLEVLGGTSNTPEALTEILVSPIVLRYSEEYQHYQALITPKADGFYYIGFHSIAKKAQEYTKIDNIEVSAAQNVGVPAAVSAMTITPDYDGALTADITFTAPTKDAMGNDLTAITAVNVIRDGAFAASLETVEPGKTYTIRDENGATNGYHTYMVIAENQYGEGVPVYAQAYIGANVPTKPTNVKMQETATGVVTLTWDAPTVDVDGQALNPALVSYTVVDASDADAKVIASDIKDTTYTFNAVEEGDQNMFSYAVFAVTAAGATASDVTPLTPVGTPYELPFNINCPNGKIEHPFAMEFNNTGKNMQGAPDISTEDEYGYDDFGDPLIPASDGDMGFIHVNFPASGAEVTLWSGRINIGAYDDAKLDFKLFNYFDGETPNKNTVTISVETEDGVRKDLKTVKCAGTDQEHQLTWIPFTVDMKDYWKHIVRVGFTLKADNYAHSMLDAISLNGEHTGIQSLLGLGAVNVRALSGTLDITAPEGTSFTVANAAGALVTTANGSRTLRVPAGVYIVRVADKTFKAIVR